MDERTARRRLHAAEIWGTTIQQVPNRWQPGGVSPVWQITKETGCGPDTLAIRPTLAEAVAIAISRYGSAQNRNSASSEGGKVEGSEG
jgi:hypothetical protein